jgi:hypothetical protein
MSETRRRRRNIDPDLEKWIEAQARRGIPPIEIYRQMTEGDQWKHLENLPLLRTVQSMAQEQRFVDKSGPWSVADEDFSPEDARLILEVFADVIAFNHKKHVFTKAEAAWVLKVRRIAPRLYLDRVWEFARAYMLAESKGESTAGLDALLAFMPWKNKNRRFNYQQAIGGKLIEESPLDTSKWKDVAPMHWVNLAPTSLAHIHQSWMQGGELHDQRVWIREEHMADWIEMEKGDSPNASEDVPPKVEKESKKHPKNVA